MDGIIALDNVPIASVLEPVHRKGIPCVTTGLHESQHFVRTDDFSGGQQLMLHVLALDHRDIGIISTAEDLNFSINLRMDGLRQAAADCGFDFDRFPIILGDFSTRGGARCAGELLQQHPTLTALICLNDRMALGAIQQALALGRRVPQDLTVVGYDDIPAAATHSPSLTTINQHGPELGRSAAHLLFALLNGDKPASRMLPVTLMQRESSAARR
jgi:DNA-binding LacI/PurR family transcriptional regulator